MFGADGAGAVFLWGPAALAHDLPGAKGHFDQIVKKRRTYRATDRPQEYGIRVLSSVKGVVCKRCPMGVDGALRPV